MRTAWWIPTAALAGAFLYLDPAQSLMPSMAEFLRPTAVAALTFLALLGAGAVALRAIAPEIAPFLNSL